MKTIIAGGRDITDQSLVQNLVDRSGVEITEVVCGCAPGVDELGRQWAVRNNIPVKYFPAYWKAFGKSAGPRRNQQMAEYAEVLLLIWDGESRGSANMLSCALKRGLWICSHTINDLGAPVYQEYRRFNH